MSESQRELYLTEQCGEDTELKQRVRALITAHRSSDGFLEDGDSSDSFELAGALRNALPSDEMPGDRIDRYKLLEQLGEGGWGVVWMAEQKEPIRRRVALKILKLGMDTKEFIARFESERQALAMMDHPHIARVFDGGATEKGRPYFVMELVRGVRITDYCDRERLDHRERLKLFLKVCHAVQHAHQKGIIHRDLKPSNILVTVNDGEAVPKVIDFGVAKATDYRLTEKTFFTRFQSFVGTPAYTSPEQIEMSSVDVDTRSDIYSLGVLLYEIMSGRTPFDPEELASAGMEHMRRKICKTEPALPSANLTSLPTEDRTTIAERRSIEVEKLPKLLRGDLDWIAMRCLEKNRNRRYSTVSGLVADVERYLSNEPVVASPPSAIYRMSKFVSRNKIAVTLSGAIAMLLLVTAIASAMLAFQAKKAADEQRVLREQASLEAQKSGEISEFIKSMFSYVDSLVELQLHRESNMQVLKDTLKETFDRATLRINNLSPDAKIEICDIIGAMYFKIREYGSAEMMFRQELAQLQAHDEIDYLKLSRTMNHLAAALGRQGKLEEAELHAREVLTIQKAQGDYESQETARALVNLSTVQLRNAAESRLSDSQRSDLLVQSQQSIESALEIQRNTLGNEHVEIAATLNELGFVLTCQGGEKLARAETVLADALQMNRKLLGEVNAAVASSVNLLAISQVMQEKYMIALKNYKQVQTIRDSLEETKISDVISSYDVSVWEHQNTGQESLDALHDVVELTMLRYEPGSLEAANLNAIEAYTFIEEGQFEEAEGKARTCLEIREKLNPEHWTPYHARSLLGAALAGQGRLKEAEPLLINGYEGVKMHRHQLEDEHKIRLSETLFRLIRFYMQAGKTEQANQWIQEATTLGLSLPNM